MSHGQGDTVISLTFGAIAAIVSNVLNWMDASTFAGDFLRAAFFGLVGGMMGYLGRMLITWGVERITKRNERKQNDQ